MRESGCQVRVAVSGGEALRHCDEQAPELAMLMMQLPDMSGRDIADDLRQRNVPFLMMSHQDDAEIVVQSIEMGAICYLYKPVDPGHIVPVINAALQRAAGWKLSASPSQPANLATQSARETSVAIGVLMERHRLSAEEAFEALRRYSRSQRRKVSEVAAQVIRAAEDINIPVTSAGAPARKIPDKSQK